MNALSRGMAALLRPCLCLVTDRRAAAPNARSLRAELLALQAQLDEAIGAGIDLIQIRERDLDAATLVTLVSDVMRRAPANPRVIFNININVNVNDRADVALVTGAGVHLRADGPPVMRVRTLGPAEWLIGRSIHSPDEAAACDADYLIFGTVFGTRSKPAGSPVAGVDALRDACARTSVPVLAIGGITPARAGACRDAGAAGLAAIAAFLPRGSSPGAPGPAEAIRAFRDAWAENTTQRGFTAHEPRE
jgi:thiamine-phosphate pyrophosphorylase